jgi:hypothetical protein
VTSEEEVLALVDRALKQYKGRSTILTSEVENLLLDIRLLVTN